MSKGPQDTALESLDEALDPELVARLHRPLVKPGIISSVIARRIMGVVDYFTSRLPLMEEMLRKRSGGGALKHDDLPVVYAELPSAPEAPAAAEVIASSDAPEERVIVRPIERIIEKPAAPTLERVIDRSAPPALDLVQEQSQGRAERATPPVMAAAQGPTTPVIQATPYVATTPVFPAVTPDSTTPEDEANPTVHITTIMPVASAVSTTVVIAAAPAVAVTPVIAAAPADRPSLPESRALPREPLTDIAPSAAVSKDSAVAAPARIERAGAARPEIQIARRFTAEPPAEVSKRTADAHPEVTPAISVRARRAQVATTFTISPRAQDPGAASRPREIDLPPVSNAIPTRSSAIGPERSMLGQRVERPGAINTSPQKLGRADEQFDAVVRPRSLRLPDGTSTDMPHPIRDAGSALGQNRDFAVLSSQETTAARLPVVKPARRIQRRAIEAALIEESSAPLARVRPSPPAGSPADMSESPARSSDVRPRVRPQSQFAATGEAQPSLALKGQSGRELPLPRVAPQKKTGVPVAPQGADPLPHAPAESLRERLGQFLPAQPAHSPGWSPGIGLASPVNTASPSIALANIASPSPPAAPGSSPPREPPESAPPQIDMNALVNQVQRKIMRNLAIDRSRRGGVR